MVDERRTSKRLELDGEWGLLEFSGFGKHYVQLYSFFYSLAAFDANEPDDRVRRTFGMFPWKGGWSAVDFFDQLRHATPPKHRLRIKEIQFASPGHIDLWAIASATSAIAMIVLGITASVNRINNTYRNIQRGIRENKLGNIDVRNAERDFSRKKRAFIDESINQLSADMKLADDDLQTIEHLSPNRLGALKIILAIFRRARELAKLQANGNMKF